MRNFDQFMQMGMHRLQLLDQDTLLVVLASQESQRSDSFLGGYKLHFNLRARARAGCSVR